MIKFKIGETELDYFNFAKHHKRMAVQIGRQYNDGSYVDLINDDTFRKDVEANPDKVFTKKQSIYKDGNFEVATDKYIWLTNSEYIDGELDYYSTGSSNTKQVTYIRLRFQFEYGLAFLDYSYKSSGSYATTFNNVMKQGIQTIVEEIMEDGSTLQDNGIALSDTGEIMMMITDSSGQSVNCEVEMYEIKSAFIGAEIYKFEQEIVTDSKELEEMR